MGIKFYLLEEIQSDFGQAFRDKKTDVKAPFITKTTDWVKLALKYAMIEAVKVDADYLSYTTGEQQADRYDLSKQLSEIRIEKSMVDSPYTTLIGIDKRSGKKGIEKILSKSDNISDYIGKDAAEKIRKTKMDSKSERRLYKKHFWSRLKKSEERVCLLFTAIQKPKTKVLSAELLKAKIYSAKIVSVKLTSVSENNTP
jgi:hypothetical protein